MLGRPGGADVEWVVSYGAICPEVEGTGSGGVSSDRGGNRPANPRVDSRAWNIWVSWLAAGLV